MVIFDRLDATQGCGPARAEFGPFYCPADETLYVDPTFLDDLRKWHRTPGDFTQAYVIAHKVANHVQQIIGFSAQVDKVQAQGNETATNQAAVRLELQADYLAGVGLIMPTRNFKFWKKAISKKGSQRLTRSVMTH